MEKADYDRANKVNALLLPEISAWWVAKRDEFTKQGLDPVSFSKISVISILTYAAMVAVDAPLTKEQFVELCNNAWEDAFNKAPRWG